MIRGVGQVEVVVVGVMQSERDKRVDRSCQLTGHFVFAARFKAERTQYGVYVELRYGRFGLLKRRYSVSTSM